MLFLNIATQPAKIHIQTTPPQIQLKTTRPALIMDTEPAIVEIRSPKGKLEIDQTPCRYSYGIKNNTDFSRDNAQTGYQAALEAIARIAQEGDRMAAIESHEDAIINMAIEANIAEPLDVTLARIANPDIRYTPQPVEYNPTPGKLNIQVEMGTVDNQLQRGKVDITVADYGSVKFWTSEGKPDFDVLV